MMTRTSAVGVTALWLITYTLFTGSVHKIVFIVAVATVVDVVSMSITVLVYVAMAVAVSTYKASPFSLCLLLCP